MSDYRRPMYGLRFHLLAARQLMSLRPGHAALQQPFHILRNDAAILGVHLRHRTQLLARFERLVQFRIVEHVKTLVRHERLERVDATLLAQHTHLLLHGGRPPCQADMETIVAAHFAIGPAAPLVVRLQQGLALLRQHEVDCVQGVY